MVTTTFLRSNGVQRCRPRYRSAALVAALALLAAACGGDDGGVVAAADEQDTITGQADGETESTDDELPTTQTTATSVPDTESTGGDIGLTVDYEDGPDELAFADDTTSTTSAGGSDSPVTTAGSGGAPVTTTGSSGGGDVSIYTGVLGDLGPGDIVVSPVVEAPAVVPGVAPLTGLPGEVPNRPAAVVKIDNSSKGRPQTGLNSADIIIEEEVEGGITRLAAVFHSTPTIVGPVRSGRTTDIGILNGFDDPLFIYSGANDVTDNLLRNQAAVQNRSYETSSGYWRSSSRSAPWNLYTDVDPHWASATGGPPPPQFAYRAVGEAASGPFVSSFTVAYRSSRAEWSWDGSAWLRRQGGSNHVTASGDQVSAANVIVIEATKVATGMVDGSGATVPEFVFVGAGSATVFTDGRRIDGTWTRPTLRSVATLTTADGSVIELTPGRTWIELIEAGSGILS